MIALIVLPLVVIGGSAYYVNSAAKQHDATPTDAIVVLGAAQFDGTPSPVLQARLQQSLDLFNKGVSSRIVTVGGKQSGDRYTEAGTGRQWLIEQGVPSDQVVAIKAGSNTLESMHDVAALASDRGWKSVTIVSDPAHMARSQAMANRFGLDAHANPTVEGDGSSVTGTYLLRETAAYLSFEILDQWSVARIVSS